MLLYQPMHPTQQLARAANAQLCIKCCRLCWKKPWH